MVRSCMRVRVHACVLVESRLASTMRGYELGGAGHAHNRSSMALHSARVSREEQRCLMAVSLSFPLSRSPSRSPPIPCNVPAREG